MDDLSFVWLEVTASASYRHCYAEPGPSAPTPKMGTADWLWVIDQEVFSNLVHVRSALWELFSLPGVSLATSYYSDKPGQHDAITGRRGGPVVRELRQWRRGDLTHGRGVAMRVQSLDAFMLASASVLLTKLPRPRPPVPAAGTAAPADAVPADPAMSLRR
jgi:hypothetical protein